jgi:hypothetical protein
MPDVFKVAEILIAHALEAHPGEIAIIAYYGSHAKGQASANSDLDLFYIPDEGQAQSLCSQFILDDLPYDFWPVSWQFAEEIANAQSERPWAVAASLIADARVLYHRSPADLDRFMALQARIAELTRQEHRPQMVERALAEFKRTLFQLEQIRLAAAADDLADLHWASWKFANSVSNCLALLNQTYFSKGWGANLAQVLQLSQRPADLDTFFQRITASQPPAQVLAAAEQLAQNLRRVLLDAHAALAQPATVQEEFKDFYFFIHEYTHKVLSACARHDVPAADYAALQLQDEICQMFYKAECGVAVSEVYLLSEYTAPYLNAGFPDLVEPASRGNLEELARRVQQLQAIASVWFQQHAIARGILDNEQELRRFLAEKDPVK